MYYAAVTRCTRYDDDDDDVGVCVRVQMCTHVLHDTSGNMCVRVTMELEFSSAILNSVYTRFIIYSRAYYL